MRSLLERGMPKPTTESITARSADVKTLCSQYEHLSIVNEILCRQRLQPVVGHSAWQKIVPAQERNTLVQDMPKGLNGNHFGNRRSFAQVQQRYYWPGWAKDMRRAVEHCEQCARLRRPQVRRQGLL